MTINIIKNLISLYKLVFINNKIYLFVSLWHIISNAVAPFITIVYFKYLLDALQFGYGLPYILKITIVMIVVNLVVTNVQIYTKSSTTLYSKWLLVPLTAMFCKKSIDMDYNCTEDQSIIQEMNRASFVLANGDNLEKYLAAVNGIFIAIIQLVFITYLATLLNPLMIIIVLAVALINAVISLKVQKKNYHIHRESLPIDRKWRYIINLATELRFAKEVRLFSLKNFVTRKGDENRAEFFSYFDKTNTNERKGLLTSTFVNILQEIGVFVILIYSVIFKGLTIGNFIVLMNGIRQFSVSFRDLFDHIVNLYTISNYVNDFFVFMNRKSELRATSKNIFIDSGSAPGKFEFINVSFHYPNDPRMILKNINLSIEPGECLVIVGENGAGKTTLVKLLMRLYDVTSGKILYNGINIQDYDYDSYMNALASVFQDFKIFAVSVHENITFKDQLEPDLCVDSLLERNNLLEKIQSLPYREKTVLSRKFESDGVELSGGQAQRLVFCRAMHKNSPVLILDEPSASLSPIAENEMYIMFSKIIKDKTTIFISHRLSSSTISDKICVLDDGEIVEYGTHSELLNKNGLYHSMYEIQSRYYKETV
ncbi:ABC transporter ATP-binding protein [Paenibacillus vandeheii]